MIMMASLKMTSCLPKQLSLYTAKTRCKNINIERKLVQKISTSCISLTSQDQISLSGVSSPGTVGSSWPHRQRHSGPPSKTPLASQIQISSMFRCLNGAYYRKYKWHHHWKTTESLAHGLAFLCTSAALLYLTYDDEYSLWFTVGECASSQDKVDCVIKVANNNKGKEYVKGPIKEKSATRHPSAEKASLTLEEAIKISQGVCGRKKEELGSPGLVVCVSVDGRQVYSEGFGYADLENEVPIQPDSVMRVASISKSITSVIVAKLWEKGEINLNEKVQHYVPDFPQKYYMGEKVDITVSHLLNHTSGIRHYKRKNDPTLAFNEQIVQLVKKTREASLLPFYTAGAVAKKACQALLDTKTKMPFDEVQDLKEKEMHNNENFATVAASLTLFQDDPLVSKPGMKMVYTTHGFTLLSAIVEAVAKQPFPQVVTKTFHSMGMEDSNLDRPKPIIHKRARNYEKDKAGKVINCPHVDNSYKWAGGGMLSTPEDLTKFGNILLYSAQHHEGDPGPPGYLKASTVWKFWSPPNGGQSVTPRYGLGFELTPETEFYGMGGNHTFGAGHTGNAVGASSDLLILPRYAKKDMSISGENSTSSDTQCKNRATPLATKNGLPQGVVVAVIVNLPGIDLRGTAVKIARTFEKVDFSL